MNMNRGGKSFWGIILVALGVMMILNNLKLFSFSWLWGFSAPVVLFVIAFFFIAGFLSKGPSSAGLLVPGGVLAGVGVTLLLGSTFHLMSYVWPGFIFAPALGLLLLYLFSNDHSPGLLVPIGILVTVGATCFLSSVLGLWHILWPGFILSPAVGLFLLYLFGERHNKGLLIPVGILGGISFFAFFGTFLVGNYGYGKYVFAAILIIAGLLSIVKKPGDTGAHGKRWFARHPEGARQDWNAQNQSDARQSADEAKSRESRREYGQQVYREYDAKFNQNPQYPGSDAGSAKPGGESPDANPYMNSDYSKYNQEPPKK
jgi:hypothetical protein